MRLDAISPISTPGPAAIRPSGTEKVAGADFGSALQESLEEVNRLQTEADKLATRVAAGDLSATSQAVVAMGKASLAFDLTMQVRNKVIEAYQELMRMQV